MNPEYAKPSMLTTTRPRAHEGPALQTESFRNLVRSIIQHPSFALVLKKVWEAADSGNLDMGRSERHLHNVNANMMTVARNISSRHPFWIQGDIPPLDTFFAVVLTALEWLKCRPEKLSMSKLLVHVLVTAASLLQQGIYSRPYAALTKAEMRKTWSAPPGNMKGAKYPAVTCSLGVTSPRPVYAVVPHPVAAAMVVPQHPAVLAGSTGGAVRHNFRAVMPPRPVHRGGASLALGALSKDDVARKLNFTGTMHRDTAPSRKGNIHDKPISKASAAQERRRVGSQTKRDLDS